ncbi:uncharacterized protein LOC124891496, partial [Capsicum annuum]|uniref:uncharacterized protein LOC124891496 n=1 Tax=Capsicum annuum TaxID=4072 RepID=UPI001FB0A801
MVKKIDHDHPLFLSPSDVPRAVQIGIQLVGMENYTLWSHAMQLNLLTKNKLGFIDGSIKRDDFTNELEKKQWDRCNAMERFDKVNMSRIFHLHKAIATHNQGNSHVSVYYSKLKDLWDEFDSIIPPPSCDCAKSKEYTKSMSRPKLLQFFMGLTDSYGQARSQILMMNPPPSVNQCYAMIIQDESQRVLGVENYGAGEGIAPTALLSNRGGGSSSGSSSRGRGGRGYNHLQRQPRGPYCDYCDMKGHTKDDCNKLKH